MKDEDLIKKYIKLSKQTKILIDNLKDFDFEKFLKWWIDNKMVVGDSHVLEYLNKKGDKRDSQD